MRTGHCPSGPNPGEAIAPLARRVDFVCWPRASVILKRPSKHETLDLGEMRRQITALRSRHSENIRITYLLNRLLIKIAYLSEPENAAHAEQLREAFARTMTDIQKRVTKHAGKPPGKAQQVHHIAQSDRRVEATCSRGGKRRLRR